MTSRQQFIYGDSIFSRVSQLAVVDMLYTGILLSDYDKYTAVLDRSSNIIRKQHTIRYRKNKKRISGRDAFSHHIFVSGGVDLRLRL